MIRQQCECPVAVIECAKTVRDADQAVRCNSVRFEIHGVANRQDRHRHHSRLGAHKVRESELLGPVMFCQNPAGTAGQSRKD